MGSVRAFASRAAVVATAALILTTAPAAAAPVIVSPSAGSTLTPGGKFQLDSGRWYPDIGGCASKVKLTLTDSAGKDWSLGKYEPRFSAFENHFPYDIYKRSVRVPEGVRSGQARLKAKQVWGFKFPVIKICIDLFSVSARRTVTIAGATGNDPPVISGLDAGDTRRQRESQPVTWSSSEPCTMALTLYQEVGDAEIELGDIVTGYASTAGPNSFDWDSRLQGVDLTTGEYRLKARCVDPESSASAPKFVGFHMGFAR